MNLNTLFLTEKRVGSQGSKAAAAPRRSKVQQWFNAFGCASAFNNGSTSPRDLNIDKFSFAAFSVVARHSTSKLGSALAPKKIANCFFGGCVFHCVPKGQLMSAQGNALGKWFVFLFRRPERAA